jgi:type II secretory pathway predicted ATPase ExeA
MVPPIMNAEKPSLSIALKTLWGAAEMPFGDACAEPFRHPNFEELTRRLHQLCEIGASGLLHGPNGIGKSYLCGCFTDKLPEKRYKILSLTHSSLTGSDLIRALCRQLGVQPQMRRSDNVANIHAALGQLGSRWPLLVLEEAQNFSASALEEVRLLTCARSDTRPPFSLLLIGEDSLLPRLQMGINHALISRLGFALALTRLEPAQSREYVSARLRAVGVHSNPFEDQGLELLIQAASGLPRAINHLARACDRNRRRRRYANHQRDTRSSRSGPLTVAGLERRLRQNHSLLHGYQHPCRPASHSRALLPADRSEAFFAL